jgi:hypothetical protein
MGQVDRRQTSYERLALTTITRFRRLGFYPPPGQIVHVNDVSLLHKVLRRKRRYAMVGYPTSPAEGPIAIEIIPLTRNPRGSRKVSFFDASCGCQSSLCLALTTFLKPEDFDGTRVRVTPHFVPGAIDILAKHSSRRPPSAPPLAA